MKMKTLIIKGRISDIELELVEEIGGYFPGIYYTDHIYVSRTLGQYFIQRVELNSQIKLSAEHWERIPYQWVHCMSNDIKKQINKSND